ncbi:MAG TPA: PP0621 family protein [Burkholderiales bacterium]|nr:PP0621 family protein [Burkholderiales bacterium]
MAKILVLVLGLLLAYWILKSYKRKVQRRADKPATGAEDMVRCAHCGVHLPRSESLTTDETSYCSVDHRRAHQKTQ